MAEAVATPLLERLRQAAGEDAVVAEAAATEPLARDLGPAAPVAPAVVVAPRDVAALVATVRAAHAAGAPLAVRGGARSYTDAFAVGRPDAVLVDTRRLDRVEPHPDDLRVSVEAGVTWQGLHAALAPLGLRAAFWGPLSGHRATVGGALSQNAVYYGSAAHGTAADTVLGLEVVLADGTLVHTGTAAHPRGSAFGRHHGPDLTGLFLGDCGTHAVKARASLALVPLPAAERVAAAAFPTARAAAAAMADVARTALADDVLGFDAYHHRLAAAAGFDGLAEERFSVHAVCSGHDEAAAAGAAAAVGRTLERAGGQPLESGLVPALRAEPFGVVRTLFAHAAPGRHLPAHAIVSLSNAPLAAERLDAYVARHAPGLRAAGVEMWTMLVVVGRSVLVEGAVVVAPGGDEAAATRARRDIASCCDDLGAVHLQLGRYYPYAEALEPSARELTRRLRAVLDPAGALNPGALALPGDG